jgi:hypothetical protein
MRLSIPLLNKIYVLVALAIGVALGWVAWGPDRSPVLAVLLPVFIASASSRWQAIAIGVGYLMGVERAGPEYIAAWFDQNLLIGLAIWLGSCLIGGLAWSLAWTTSTKPWRMALACVIAWAVTLLPPVAILAMGHTSIAWGYLLPGGGWVALALSALAPAAVVAALAYYPWADWGRYASIGVASLALGTSSYFYTPTNTQFVADMMAVTTQWGAAREPKQILERIEKIGLTVNKLGADKLVNALVYPESILQTYDPTIFGLLSDLVLDPAAENGITMVLGMDLLEPSGHYQTVATAIYPDRRSATANVRQTVPIALWKPWASKESFLSDWTANNILPIKEGIKARVIFCYEEYIPVLSLINEALDEHNLVLVMSNTWASEDELGNTIQALHSQGIALMFNRAMLRADNRPRPNDTEKK